jgi:hypothetical protein
MGDFADPEQGLLSPIAVRRCTRETPLELPPIHGSKYCAAIDPSDAGAGSNGMTLAIVHREKTRPLVSAPPVVRYLVALTREWRGENLEQIWREIASVCQRYGLTDAWTDQYAAAANTALAGRYGLSLHVDRTSASSKVEDYTNFATHVHTAAVELPPDRQVRSDLLSVRRRTTQTGVTIVLPKSRDGRHADFAPAIVAAVKHAASSEHSGAYGTSRAMFRADRGHVGDGKWHELAPPDRGERRGRGSL